MIKLEESFAFKEKCIEIYEKSLINYHVDIFGEGSTSKSQDFEHDDSIGGDEANEEHIDDDPLIKTEIDEELDDEEFHLIDDAPQIDSAEISIGESRKWSKQNTLNETHLVRKQPNPFEQLADPETIVIIENTVVGSEYVKEESEKVGKIKSRKSYTSGEKLEAIKYAEITGRQLRSARNKVNVWNHVGNRQAAKIFSIDESCIRKWRQNKELLIVIHRERGTKRKPNLHWPDLDKSLKDWVMVQLNSGTRVKPSEIKAKSIEIAKDLNITNFKGTSSYIFKFMSRYRIPGRRDPDAEKAPRKKNNK